MHVEDESQKTLKKEIDLSLYAVRTHNVELRIPGDHCHPLDDTIVEGLSKMLVARYESAKKARSKTT